jgi:hypothetical protein
MVCGDSAAWLLQIFHIVRYSGQEKLWEGKRLSANYTAFIVTKFRLTRISWENKSKTIDAVSFESPHALIKPVYFEHLTECQCTNEHFNSKKIW